MNDNYSNRGDNLWALELVNQNIESIYKYTIDNFDSLTYWPTHPDEDTDIEINKSFYNGASGTFWGLNYISKYLEKTLPFNKKELISKIYSDYLKEPDTKESVPSIFVGEVSILLVKYIHDPSIEVEDRLYKLIEILRMLLWSPYGELLEQCLVLHTYTT